MRTKGGCVDTSRVVAELLRKACGYSMHTVTCARDGALLSLRVSVRGAKGIAETLPGYGIDIPLSPRGDLWSALYEAILDEYATHALMDEVPCASPTLWWAGGGARIKTGCKMCRHCIVALLGREIVKMENEPCPC